MSIPDSHEKGQLESPKLYKLEFRWNYDRHVMVRQVVEQGHDDWMTSLQNAGEDDLLLFVHGYRTTWADAAKRAAQIAYDMEFAGLTVMDTWPSQGKVFGYRDDIEESEWAGAAFHRTAPRPAGKQPSTPCAHRRSQHGEPAHH